MTLVAEIRQSFSNNDDVFTITVSRHELFTLLRATETYQRILERTASKQVSRDTWNELSEMASKFRNALHSKPHA